MGKNKTIKSMYTMDMYFISYALKKHRERQRRKRKHYFMGEERKIENNHGNNRLNLNICQIAQR